MTEEQIRQANPEVNPKRLKVGQQINLVVAEPYVHLESVEQVTYDEAIPFPVEVEKDETLWPWQEVVKERGATGKRQVTVTIKRNNGAVVDRQVIDTKILSEPRKQVVRRGTKIAPDRGTGSFRWPLVGTITSKYGFRWRGFHDGVDIAAPTGTPISVADSGTVTFAGWKGKLGKAIVIDHGGGNLVTIYGHLSAFNVEAGDVVEKGDVIGYVGNTGRSTGPHLHFEIRKSGKSVNPFTFYSAQ
jgi:murein DD-endopeptidase MepM/ murein hydrolase activator NlpD